MIEELRSAGLLSVVRDGGGLIGYRYAGVLYEVFEQLDRNLVELCTADAPAVPHSYSTVLDREVLDRIEFLDKLPSIPFAAVPHARAVPGPERFLSPSVCYSTFAHLAGTDQRWDLSALTSRGRCHRHETAASDAARPASFEMREIVLVGDRDRVVDRCELLLERTVGLLRSLGEEVRVEAASDVFYGERSRATRKVQRALGVKREILLPWRGATLAVGSRNLHRDLFTSAFGIGPQPPAAVLHSSCVAFGLDRMLFALLAGTPGRDPEVLGIRLERARSAAPQAVRA